MVIDQHNIYLGNYMDVVIVRQLCLSELYKGIFNCLYAHTQVRIEIVKLTKGLRALRPFFGPHLRSKYESGN